MAKTVFLTLNLPKTANAPVNEGGKGERRKKGGRKQRREERRERRKKERKNREKGGGKEGRVSDRYQQVRSAIYTHKQYTLHNM